MKNKGYTIIDIIILVIVLAASAILILPRLSTAFVSNNEELHDSQMNLYLKQAKLYGEKNIDKIKENNNSIIVTIDDLIDAGYIGAYVSKELTDDLDESVIINDLKIKITYNEETKEITVQYI